MTVETPGAGWLSDVPQSIALGLLPSCIPHLQVPTECGPKPSLLESNRAPHLCPGKPGGLGGTWESVCLSDFPGEAFDELGPVILSWSRFKWCKQPEPRAQRRGPVSSL